MKTMNLIKIIPVVMLGFALSTSAGTAKGHDGRTYHAEMEVTMESWMFDSSYLSGAEISVEPWMMDNHWLDQSAESVAIESWMLDESYLDEEIPVIETWMTDESYLR